MTSIAQKGSHMRVRFRRSIRVVPGVKINLNKKSAGVTIGRRGMHYTVNTKGQQTTSVGLPGTGLSVQHTSKPKRSRTSPALTTANSRLAGLGVLGVILVIVVLLLVVH